MGKKDEYGEPILLSVRVLDDGTTVQCSILFNVDKPLKPPRFQVVARFINADGSQQDEFVAELSFLGARWLDHPQRQEAFHSVLMAEAENRLPFRQAT